VVVDERVELCSPLELDVTDVNEDVEEEFVEEVATLGAP
jgi:hypothetical protein